MFELIFFACVSLSLLAAFLLLGAKKRHAETSHVPALHGTGQIIRLESLSFGNSARMLDGSDYGILAANPRLRRVADQFRSERQELVLQWISALLRDLHSLWRLRRVLVRHGAPIRFDEEFKIFRTFPCCCTLLFALKLSVRVVGPFAVGHFVRQAAGMIGKMSDLTASTFARIPSAVWPEIERSWAAQAA